MQTGCFDFNEPRVLAADEGMCLHKEDQYIGTLLLNKVFFGKTMLPFFQSIIDISRNQDNKRAARYLLLAAKLCFLEKSLEVI